MTPVPRITCPGLPRNTSSASGAPFFHPALNWARAHCARREKAWERGYIYTTWDHGLALSGRQGSSLSLKHGLCVSASLNSYTQSHSRQGEATPPVVRVQQPDHGHGVVPITKGQSYQGQEYMRITPTC